MTEPTDENHTMNTRHEPPQPPLWAQPTTLPQPTPPTDRPVDGPDDGAAVAELRAQVGELVRELTGPVSRVVVESGSARIEIEWSQAAGVADGAADPAARTDAIPGTATDPPAPAADDPELHRVTAPLIGTFYAAPEPGADPFIRPGDAVHAGQTVGIIEAMKIMNHITTEHAGRVVEIVAANGEAVEFGQELVRIALRPEPSDADPVPSRPAGGAPPAGDGTDAAAGARPTR